MSLTVGNYLELMELLDNYEHTIKAQGKVIRKLQQNNLEKENLIRQLNREGQ